VKALSYWYIKIGTGMVTARVFHDEWQQVYKFKYK